MRCKTVPTRIIPFGEGTFPFFIMNSDFFKKVVDNQLARLYN
ncbi:hypothetical protein B4114_0716 [Geobacillus stearothermophilus]|uniref:Uncharacterized protein n=1 Tax=Geobacillus stearothermophilus TaxID=1422 RepID=A0A150N6T6_GEOSE|nr:hypothetical protein B4114_0716 [Geobacillus stearothermophilus]